METNQEQQDHHLVFKPVEPPHKDFLQRHQVAGFAFVAIFIVLAILFNYKMRIYRELMDVNIPAHQKAVQMQSANSK